MYRLTSIKYPTTRKTIRGASQMPPHVCYCAVCAIQEKRTRNTGSLFRSVLLTPSNRCHFRLSPSHTHTHTTVHPHYTLHTTTPKRRAFRINETIHNISLCLTGTWCENDAHYYLFTASFMLIMWNGISFIACILFELKNVLLFTYFVDSMFSCFNLSVCVWH